MEIAYVSYNPPRIPDDVRTMAKKFFEHAVTVAETHNYDYAIELYLQGLAKDPQAVDLGHKVLREISLKRAVSGGKKAGLFESIKRGSAKKDLYQSFLNSEYLLAKDPLSAAHGEALVKAFDNAELPEALGWSLGVLLELARQEKKPSPQRLLFIQQLSEKLGDYYNKSDQPDIAIGYYQIGVNALEFGIQARATGEMDFVGKQRDLAGKLTILRGKYERADTFRDSIRDAGKQQEMLDLDRVVKGDDMMRRQIDNARAELQASPEVSGKINALCDLLLQRGKDDDEQEAIALLQSAYERTRQYAFKLRADDVRIRRKIRLVKDLRDQLADGEPPELKACLDQAQKEFDEFELDIYQQRVKEYPTDTKVKFELARRLHKVKRYDEAIPVFQEVLSDPRHAVRAKYYIGACFFQKGWNQQAIDILNEAAERYEMGGDSLNKEMHYVLARAYENAGLKPQALKTFSKIIQWDFNYRDVRQRIDKLQGPN